MSRENSKDAILEAASTLIMAKGADVPKMTTEFVAGEILRHIREESIDPPIGEEAEGVLARLKADPVGLEEFLSAIRA